MGGFSSSHWRTRIRIWRADWRCNGDCWKIYRRFIWQVGWLVKNCFEGWFINYLEYLLNLLCFRSSKCLSVNECRKYLFTKKDRQIEHLPPTKAALHQHFLRAVYQGVHVWGQMAPVQSLPCPVNWGWVKVGDNWQPKWTELPIAADACLEMVRCKCKKQCGTRCSCRSRQLKCSNLCLCNGTCYTNT